MNGIINESVNQIGSSTYSLGPQEQPDSFVNGMISNNNIAGILKYRIEYSDDFTLIKYSTNKGVPLSIIKPHINNGKDFLIILRNCLGVLNELSEYLIDSRKVILNSDKIFIDSNTFDTYLTVVPTDKNQNSGISSFIREYLMTLNIRSIEIDDAVAFLMQNPNGTAAEYYTAISKIISAHNENAYFASAETALANSNNNAGINNTTPNINAYQTSNNNAAAQNISQQNQQQSPLPFNTPEAPTNEKSEAPKEISSLKKLFGFGKAKSPTTEKPPKQSKSTKEKNKSINTFNFNIPNMNNEQPNTAAPLQNMPNTPKIPAQPQQNNTAQNQPLPQTNGTVLIRPNNGTVVKKNTPRLIGADGKVINIDKDSFAIGRANSKFQIDLALADDGVGRFHALIISKNGDCYLIDQASINGTYVNGQQIPSNTETPIRKGDTISFYNCIFKFYM